MKDGNYKISHDVKHFSTKENKATLTVGIYHKENDYNTWIWNPFVSKFFISLQQCIYYNWIVLGTNKGKKILKDRFSYIKTIKLLSFLHTNIIFLLINK